MAARVFHTRLLDIAILNKQQIRHGHHMRGLPPTLARSLKERLKELDKTDPELSFKVDIGFKPAKYERKDIMKSWMAEVQANRLNPNLERKSRNKELLVDLKKVKEDWLKTDGQHHLKKILEHHGVYNDLFGDAYFIPVLPLNIEYHLPDLDVIPKVYTGNILKPHETQNLPSIKYDADPNSLWTLLMTTPDGNFTNHDHEYCHWFIGNIPGNDVAKGEQIIDYLRPIPAKGLGYCRYIFVLYKQEKAIDYTAYKKSQPCLSLLDRDWSTLEFFRKHQDILTPAGLAFFQADWDETLTKFYHQTLKMKEPRFEYDFPKPYIKPQVWFPLKQPFNIYLDKYRDPKEINKEFFLKKMKEIHPFKPPEPPLKFPNAYAFDKHSPAWLRWERKKERLGWGRINEIE